MSGSPGECCLSPRRRRPAGSRSTLAPASGVDMVRLDGIAAPFLKRVMVEGSGDRARWTTLAADATLFDLPDERLRQNSLPFAAGPYRYFRVTWDDTNSARVANPTTVEARSAGLVSAAGTDDVLGHNRAPSERAGAQPLSRSTSGRRSCRSWRSISTSAPEQRRSRLSAGDRQRVAFRGARGGACRTRTGDAHARHA